MFNAKAGSYARHAVVQRQLARWLAEWLEPVERMASLTALEFGSGDGQFTRMLAARFSRVIAIDSAPQMVARGTRLLPRMEWRVADAWSVKNRPVDRLFSASLLQWCDDPASVLRHWRTLAKREAKMLHGFYVAPTLIEWQSMEEWSSPIEWRGPQQWETYFRDAGWTLLRSEAERRELRFSSALELLRFFHRTGAITPRNTPLATLRRMIAAYDCKFRCGEFGSPVTSTWTFFRIEVAN